MLIRGPDPGQQKTHFEVVVVGCVMAAGHISVVQVWDYADQSSGYRPKSNIYEVNPK